jgi:hypothetical protein
MRSKSSVVLLAVLVLGLSAADAVAQDADAEVRTWSGRLLRLSQASFEIRYTIVLARGAGGALGGGGGGALAGGAIGGSGTGGVGGGVYGSPMIGMGTSAGGVGSLSGFQQFVSQSPDAIQGRRLIDYLDVYQEGVSHRLAVNRIATIAFKRQPVLNSTLLPYVAPEHIYSAATVTFTDGSTLDGDNVNPGTLLLRGTTPEGRVEIPWQEIESVRFTR